MSIHGFSAICDNIDAIESSRIWYVDYCAVRHYYHAVIYICLFYVVGAKHALSVAAQRMMDLCLQRLAEVKNHELIVSFCLNLSHSVSSRLRLILPCSLDLFHFVSSILILPLPHSFLFFLILSVCLSHSVWSYLILTFSRSVSCCVILPHSVCASAVSMSHFS